MFKNKLNTIIKGTLNSYSQIFFSDNKIFGIILLFVSFFDVYAGFAGVISVITTNALAKLLGFNEFNIKEGRYGFNSLLVGLGIGLTYTPGVETLILVLVASITTLLLTITLEGFLSKYALPFLSIPFLITIWLVIIAGRDLSALGLSERGIYTTNELYLLGGKALTDIYNWFESVEKPLFLKTYFLSLGAIFFQYHILAGIIIAIGILIYSRISFLLSILGFTTAFVFYKILGVDITQYSYTFIGFNYILTAIAIGGHFLVPNKYSFLAVVLLLPVVVLFTLSTSRLLAPYQLPVFSLPFNVVVILFLYFLKLRTAKHEYLKEIITQLNNPEKNLYFYEQAEKRFKWLTFYPVSLPFMGQWTVAQGHNGEYTHQGEWKHAWDFVITDDKGSQYSGSGDLTNDYFCYGKNVTAPATGIIVDVVDGINDNTIGEVNLLQNWGNSLVIKHTEYLYSQLSHLKKNSFKVKKGDFIQKGDVLAQCGNSGRSPYPHLHFQLQATPYIGSKTLDYPIDHYIKINNKYQLHSYEKPEKDDTVSSIKISELLKNAFNLIPGKKLNYKFNGIIESWEVKTDYYNNTFIHCTNTNSYAYLFNDGFVHYFKSFSGNKNSALFHFYMALYQVPLGFYEKLTVNDILPPDIITNKTIKILNDFLAPFYHVLKVDFKLEYHYIDNELMPDEIILISSVTQSFFNKKTNPFKYKIFVTNKGIIRIEKNSDIIELIP